MDQSLQNIFTQAKTALTDDLKGNLYQAVQARQSAFRQLNNKANAQHMMFSGMPMALQAQYDAGTFIPQGSKMVIDSLQKQQSNQDKWDEYMRYVQDINSKAQEVEDATRQFSYTAPTGEN